MESANGEIFSKSGEKERETERLEWSYDRSNYDYIKHSDYNSLHSLASCAKLRSLSLLVMRPLLQAEQKNGEVN